MPDMISMGECMIELFSEQPMETADTFQRSFAGDSLNILVAAARLGTSTGYVTRLGSDPFTSYLLSSWQTEGIDTSQVKRVEGFNAVHFVAQLPGGDREFVYYRKGSAPSHMEPDDLDPEYIGAAKILHVSGIAQAISESAKATTLKAAQIAHERGVSVSYDPNYRHQLWSHEDAREAMEQTLPYVTYFMPSAPVDTDVLFGTSVPEDVISEARSRGVRITVVKLGERGVVVGTPDSIIECPAYTPGRVVDTTGAGDAFNGAFLHGLLNGMNVEDAATLGTVTAGLKVRGRGALTTMPTSDEVHDHFKRAKGGV